MQSNKMSTNFEVSGYTTVRKILELNPAIHDQNLIFAGDMISIE